jgi:hypothetical protein
MNKALVEEACVFMIVHAHKYYPLNPNVVLAHHDIIVPMIENGVFE